MSGESSGVRLAEWARLGLRQCALGFFRVDLPGAATGQ
eukprot:CAMPEP_0206054892 /NCGR_PEP_ID=MMETSP1466-20131121/39056_1 /ASSEMBLY_ACC=CAM_ASM_001126 /TAXON_ID=44452 /ORGANISM="Pavlova gyrans, Strain CCMP608" /LENGTH=37 /DNA_ID= /DNA_START= /DNA_END= /DNA_ORIENTATION=